MDGCVEGGCAVVEQGVGGAEVGEEGGVVAGVEVGREGGASDGACAAVEYQGWLECLRRRKRRRRRSWWWLCRHRRWSCAEVLGVGDK